MNIDQHCKQPPVSMPGGDVGTADSDPQKFLDPANNRIDYCTRSSGHTLMRTFFVASILLGKTAKRRYKLNNI